jgi:hypothetical protein
MMMNNELMRHAGAKMANTMFNLAQRAGEVIDSDLAAEFDKIRKEWDEAVRAPSSSHPAEGERQSIDTPEFKSLLGACVGALEAQETRRHVENVRTALIAHIDTWAGRSAGDAVPADQRPTDESNVMPPFAAPAGQHNTSFEEWCAQAENLPSFDPLETSAAIRAVRWARAAWDAAMRTQQAAPPAGFTFAPMEPTEAMVHAAEDLPAPRMFGKVYRAMLAAAPAPQAAGASSPTNEEIVEITRPFWNAKIRWFDVVGLYRFVESDVARRCRAQGGITSESSNESCVATPANTAPAVQPEKVAELWNQQADEFNQWSELGADEKAEWIAKLSWDSANESAGGSGNAQR